MSGLRESVPAACHQALWTLIGCIPGCTLSHATIDPAGTTAVTIGMDGWSPSLHAVSIEIAGRILHPAGEAAMLRQLRAVVAPVAATQRRRAAAGLALGQPTPFRHGDSTVETGHLLIDASLLALLLSASENAGWTPERTVHEQIAKPLHHLHHSAVDHGGGDTLSDQVATVRDTVHGPVVEVAFLVERDGADPSKRYRDGKAVVTMEGRTVLVHGRSLPHTAAASAVGRPLGDIAAIHPLLDGRAIEAVEVGDEWFEVALRPRYARIGEILRLGADDAIRHLGFDTATEC